MLEVRGLTSGYGGLAVVRDLDLSVARGEVVALLGANGAGKTTTLATIAGVIPPISGSITLDGAEIGGVAAHRLARRGVSLVPENRALFAELTARENLRVAVRGGRVKDAVGRVLEFLPELAKCLERPAGMLSGGEQQMLAVARALVTGPRLLIVDEMSLGLAPVVVGRLLPVLRDVADAFDAAVLVVEQHVQRALEVADRGYVLAHGRIVLEGNAERLAADRELLSASYFGDAKVTDAIGTESPATESAARTPRAGGAKKTATKE